MNTDLDSQVEFDKLVADHYNQLTKSEKRIAYFINQNQDEVAFMSASEVATALNLSEPTMLRFAHALGFKNYPSLRFFLQSKFRNLVNHSTRIRSRLGDLRIEGDVYEQIVTSEIDFLTESLHTLDRSALHTAVELLHVHQRVFVFGVGPAISLVDQLEIRLTRSLRHVIPLRSYGREIIEPLLLMNKNDLLIAFVFHTVNPYLELALERANEYKVPVIVITDTLRDRIANRASVVLSARRGPVSSFHSMTIPMIIVNTLILCLTSLEQEKIMNNLDKLDELRERVNPTPLKALSAKRV